MTNEWQLLSFPPFEDVKQAKEQCHQAIQNVSALGRSFLERLPLDETGNLTWDSQLERLVGHWIQGEKMTFRSSFCIKEFAVYLVNDKIETIAKIKLEGKTQTEVMVWLEEELIGLGEDISKLNLKVPYQIPLYPTAKGKPFHIDNPDALLELSKYYHNTDYILKKLLPNEEKVTEVRCWPHHFDMAAKVILYDSGDLATSRTISIGMSPGDNHYDEPYFYVSPWPYTVDNLPDISHTFAHWNEEDWIGAVLPISKITHLDLARVQRKTVVQEFYQTAVSILKSLL